MVQLFTDLPQVIVYDLLFVLCQRTPAMAAFRIGFDTVFKRCVAQQVGMEKYTRIVVGMPLLLRGYLDHLTGINQP